MGGSQNENKVHVKATDRILTSLNQSPTFLMPFITVPKSR